MRSVLVLLLLVSCGYQWQHETRPFVSIPFVKGDENGAFTTELIRAFAASGIRVVGPERARYRLEVEMGPLGAESIGYRRDPQKIQGEVKKNMLPIESRRSQTLKVQLILVKTGEVIAGPMEISADVDFDFYDGDSAEQLSFFTPGGVQHTVLSFSLGQLESQESAQEAASRPLWRRLAERVVEAMQGAAEWRE